jgi:signal transduction histidine kinase
LGHDMSTPLTPLLALLPMMIEDEKDNEKRDFLNMTLVNLNFLRGLATKTQRLAELDSRVERIKLQELSLKLQVSSALDSKSIAAEKKGVTLNAQVDQNLLVRADRITIREVLDNLLDNAIKFTPEGGSVTISAHKSGEFATVSVKDTGIGMKEEQLVHMFEEFYKADPSRHDLESHGLGLAICQRIIAEHGGRIWAESQGLGKGSSFCFTLQLA